MRAPTPSGAAAGIDTVTYASRTGNVTADIDSVADDGTAGDANGALRDNIRGDIENLIGGTGHDTLTGWTSNNTLDGGAGADTFWGGGGIDTVTYAVRTGNVTADIDSVADDGTAGDANGALRDNIRGDVENLIGGTGHDTLTGWTNDNTLDGGAGADTFWGGGGVDTVTYWWRTGNVTADIDSVADDGTAGDANGALRDNIRGDVENLVGGSGHDTLHRLDEQQHLRRRRGRRRVLRRRRHRHGHLRLA